MARGLYRVYLYVVTIALAVFLTVSVSSLLSALLRLTSLRGQYGSAPAGSELTQTIVLALVTLIIVAGLGGLHYWLIRRDMASDPQPGASGVRAFTLNLALGAATLVAVFGFASALTLFSLTFQNDIATSLAISLAAFGLALALGWERRRATPSHGAALVFERLRVDGLGLILALAILGYAGAAISQTERLIGEGTGAITCTTTQPNGPYNGPFNPTCVGSEMIGQWAALLLVAVVWLLYLRAGANGQRTLMRPVFLLLGFTAGVIALIVGLERGAEYLLRLATSTASARPDYLNSFDVGPALVFAALALSVYGWRLRQSASHEPLDLPTTRLTMRAIGSALFAAPLWFGAGMLLNNLFIKLFPGQQFTDTNWPTAAAVTIAGAAYVPLALWLGSGSHAEGIRGPRRGFVLAMLAAGSLATAGGAATLIYSVVTALLGVPLPNWQSVARPAGAALVIGLVVGGLYLWLALREGQFTRAPKPEPVAPEAPTAAEGAAIINAAALDDVLAQLQQGSLSRAEATDRIRALARTGALV
ncbi:MAG TPA: hypothetical protein VE338_02480 [Ktedonobacterales bacterium]|jgi:hypothetical protein|nr:hypothetical protein [Ktedonobacterales bacterium]